MVLTQQQLINSKVVPSVGFALISSNPHCLNKGGNKGKEKVLENLLQCSHSMENSGEKFPVAFAPTEGGSNLVKPALFSSRSTLENSSADVDGLVLGSVSLTGVSFTSENAFGEEEIEPLVVKVIKTQPSTSNTSGPHTCFVGEKNMSQSLIVVDCQTKLAGKINEERVLAKERDCHVAAISSASGKFICCANQFQSSTSIPSGSHWPFGDLKTIFHSLDSEDCKTTTLNSLNRGSHKECGIKSNDVPISHATTSIIQPLVSKELPIQPFSTIASGPNMLQQNLSPKMPVEAT